MKSQIAAYRIGMTATRANAGSKRAVDAPAGRFVGEVLRQVVTLVPASTPVHASRETPYCFLVCFPSSVFSFVVEGRNAEASAGRINALVIAVAQQVG